MRHLRRPGRTDRQLTVDDLTETRDVEVPKFLQMFNRREVLLTAWSARTFENARRAKDDLFGDQNNRKRYVGYIAALLDQLSHARSCFRRHNGAGERDVLAQVLDGLPRYAGSGVGWK